MNSVQHQTEVQLKSKLQFDNATFYKTIIISVLLNSFWTVLCVATNEFTTKDKGFISGFGYLLMYCLTFFLGMKEKYLLLFLKLLCGVILIFLISSFIVAPLIDKFIWFEKIPFIASSLVSALALTFLLDKIYEIQMWKLTFVLTFVAALIANILMLKIDNALFLSFDVRPRMTMFLVWQILTSITLALGLTLRLNNVQTSNG